MMRTDSSSAEPITTMISTPVYTRTGKFLAVNIQQPISQSVNQRRVETSTDQRVFLRAKLKPHCFSLRGGDVEQPTSLCANMTSSTKPEMRNVSLRRQKGTEPRP